MTVNVGSILYTVDMDTKKVVQGEQQVDKSMGKIGKNFADTQAKANRLTTALSPLATAISGLIAIDTVRRMQALSEQFTLLESRVKRLSSSAQEATETYRQLLQISSQTGADISTTVGLWENLSGSLRELGKSNTEVLALVSTLQKIGTIGGSSAEDLSNALRQLGQGFAGGVIRAEEFNSVLEGTPEIARQIAKGLGITLGELRQQMLDGQLTAERVLGAIQERAATVDAEFAKLPRTVSQASNAIVNAMGEAISKLDQATGASTRLAQALDLVAKGIRLTSGNLSDQERLNVLFNERVQVMDDLNTHNARWLKNGSEINRLTQRKKELDEQILAIQNRRIEQQRKEKEESEKPKMDLSAPENPKETEKAKKEAERARKAAAREAAREEKAAQREAEKTQKLLEKEEEQRRRAAKEKVEKQQQVLGQEDPIAGEQQRFQQQLANLKMLNEAKLIEDQRYLDLKAQAEFAHDEQMKVLQEENYRRQSVANELLMASLDQLQQGATNALVGLVTGANNSEEAVRGLATSILNEAVGALVQLGIEQVKNMVLGQTAQATAAAGAAATGAAMTASYAPAAAAASIASFGGAAGAGLAALASAIPAALGLFGGRQYGGPVTPGGMYRINESGAPEVFNAANGRQYMLPNQKGQVVSNKDATSNNSSGGAPIVNVHNYSGSQSNASAKFSETDRAWVIDVVVGDMASDGKIGRTSNQITGTRRPGR